MPQHTRADDPADAPVPEEWVAVGRVGPARGIRGDLFVEPWTDAPDERFAAGAILHRRPDGTLTVESASRAGGKQVVHFVGVDGREAAEALRGTELFVRAAERPALEDPEDYYTSDLVGLAATTPDGAPLGPVVDVQHAGAAAYLVVSVDGQDRLVPFVAAIVPSVDLAGGTVTVDPPDGLFDL